MMYDEDSTIRLITDDGRLIVNESDTIYTAVFRVVAGCFLMGVGGLVLYVFLSGGGPMPAGSLLKQILGWIIVSFLFMVMGLVPAWGGFRLAFTRNKLVVNNQQLQLHVTFGGWPIWIRTYASTSLDNVLISWRKLGVFGAGWRIVVSCSAGPRREVDLAAFANPQRAATFAEDIAAKLGRPVIDQTS
jgi:hypothetical protein